MSILPMFRVCPHCRRRFTYNPSAGRFGLICPKCGKYIGMPFDPAPSGK